MLKGDQLTELSRTVSHALRHEQVLYGIALYPEGWVAVADLIPALQTRSRKWRAVEQADLVRIIETSSKKRLEIVDGQIRAFYGDSQAVTGREPHPAPPAILYHGTTPQAAESIRKAGLLPRRRQYVHLSSNTDTATVVARRRTGTPVIFTVDTAAALASGVAFYFGNEDTWMAGPIPAVFLDTL
jgi:putative RNA 2'-phosphotransferase